MVLVLEISPSTHDKLQPAGVEFDDIKGLYPKAGGFPNVVVDYTNAYKVLTIAPTGSVRQFTKRGYRRLSEAALEVQEKYSARWEKRRLAREARVKSKEERALLVSEAQEDVNRILALAEEMLLKRKERKKVVTPSVMKGLRATKAYLNLVASQNCVPESPLEKASYCASEFERWKRIASTPAERKEAVVKYYALRKELGL